MEPYWIFLILAIIIAFNSDKIDTVAKANNKLKKWLIAICTFMAITSILLIIKSLGVISWDSGINNLHILIFMETNKDFWRLTHVKNEKSI